MATADHLYVSRLGGLYSHHGIDLGDGSVIHYTGDDWRSSRVRCTVLAEFSLGSPVHVRSYADFYRAASLEDLIVREASRRAQSLLELVRGLPAHELDASPESALTRARSRLGEGGFDFVFNNCEHFATWCKTGIHDSRQIASIWKFALNPPKYAAMRTASWLTAAFDRSSHHL